MHTCHSETSFESLCSHENKSITKVTKVRIVITPHHSCNRYDIFLMTEILLWQSKMQENSFSVSVTADNYCLLWQTKIMDADIYVSWRFDNSSKELGLLEYACFTYQINGMNTYTFLSFYLWVSLTWCGILCLLSGFYSITINFVTSIKFKN